MSNGNGDGDDNSILRKSAVQIGAQILVALAVGMGSAYLTATSSMARMDERLKSAEDKVEELKEDIDQMEAEYYRTQRQNRNRLIRLELTLYQIARQNGVDVPEIPSGGGSASSSGGAPPRLRMPRSFPRNFGPPSGGSPSNDANND